jgi:hypothetical protein
MPHKHSRLQSVVMRCQDPNTPADEYLVCRINILCEVCGVPFDYQIMGHHIPAVIKALTKAMELYPDLCKEVTTEVPQGTTLVIPRGGREDH